MRTISMTKPKTKGDPRQTDRGLRNNNPGNIRHSPTKWEGMAEIQLDKDFVSFESMAYGVRAMAKILLTYQKKYGLNSIYGIIHRWAPPNENNTTAYVNSVVGYMIHENVNSIDLSKPGEMFDLVTAIVDHENYKGAYADIRRDITTGIQMAYGAG